MTPVTTLPARRVGEAGRGRGTPPTAAARPVPASRRHHRHAVTFGPCWVAVRAFRRVPWPAYCRLAGLLRSTGTPPHRPEVPAKGDFNLGEHGIRDIRGRVVSRLSPLTSGRGCRTGYNFRRFTGSPALLAITCAGYLGVIFFGLFCPAESLNMNDFKVSITTTTRRRKLKDGTVREHPQWYCEYREPQTRKRRRRAFVRKRDAEAFRNALLLKVAEGAYVDERKAPAVAQAIDHWLQTKTGTVKASTLKSYKASVTGAIRGPLLVGTKQERADYTESGVAPKGARFLKLLGHVKLTDLNTATIRAWHRTVTEQCGAYTANRAKSHLKSILALAEEDFGIRAPSMPTGLPRVRHKAKKAILTPEHIAKLITAAREDAEHGIFVAFPFLAGTRPSEQLGLLWSEVDFERNVIHIRRIQERDGSLTEMTKTEAGTRDKRAYLVQIEEL